MTGADVSKSPRPRPTPTGRGARVLENFLYLLLAQAVSAAAGLVSTVFLARTLGAEAYGMLGFGTATLSYFGLLVVLGTDVYGMREMSQGPERAGIVARLLGLRLALLVAVAIAYALAVGAMGLDARVRTVLLIQGLGLIAAALGLDFVFQAVQRMRPVAMRQIMASLLALAAVLLLVRNPGDVFIAAAITPTALAIAAGWLAWRMDRGITPFAMAFAPTAWGRVLRAAIPIAVAQIMYTLFFNIDIVMLGFMASQRDVGLYVAMSRMLQTVLLLGNMVVAAFSPALAAAWPTEAAMRRGYRDFVTAAMFLGAPAAAVGIAFPDQIIGVIFGADFAGASGVLALLMATAVLLYAGLAAGTALLTWHDQTWSMVVHGIGGLSNIAFNLVLIPRYGIEGAAVATLTSQVLILILLTARVAVRFRMSALMPALRLAGCAAVAFAAVRLAASLLPGLAGWPDIVRLAVEVVAGGALYLGLALAVRAVEPRRVVAPLLARLRGRRHNGATAEDDE